MNTEVKLIKSKLGLINLAEELGNVSQACKVMGYSRDTFFVSVNFMIQEENWLFRKSAEKSRP
jgi:hypothetical protein